MSTIARSTLAWASRCALVIGPLLGVACAGPVEQEELADHTSAALGAARGGSLVPADARYQGKSLTQWLTLYTRWMYTGEPESGSVGNVTLLPMPEMGVISEDPLVVGGTMELALHPGSALVFPCVGYGGESYTEESGIPDDQPAPAEILHCDEVMLDGKVLDITGEYYVFDTLDPEIAYPEPSDYGSDALIFHQSIGAVLSPLGVGEHTLSVASGIATNVAFDNTWEITVAAR